MSVLECLSSMHRVLNLIPSNNTEKIISLVMCPGLHVYMGVCKCVYVYVNVCVHVCPSLSIYIIYYIIYVCVNLLLSNFCEYHLQNGEIHSLSHFVIKIKI